MPSRYQAPLWLPGAHAQTLWPLLRRPPRPHYRRERWETPDGDFIDLDWIDTPAQAPLLALFHGLEGSSDSHYARALMLAISQHGWRGVVVHFRGCSGEPNRLARAYHSGDSTEVDWILRRLRSRHDAALFAVGISLGGNALLKWLGEQGGAAAGVVTAAAAISAPLDLAAADAALSHGVSRLYARHFLRTLIPKALTKLERFPGLYRADTVCAARTLRDFDAAVTAPLHGFSSAADYYARSSAAQYLSGIAVKTLLVNALNDPFLPANVLPAAHSLPATVTLETPRGGGHAGFVSGPFPGHLNWLPQRLLKFFQ
ncbi:MAG: hydrolase [Betaproteobacteria bacterium]|nr:hydrolase [Betaproteobacteria bacterium]